MGTRRMEIAPFDGKTDYQVWSIKMKALLAHHKVAVALEKDVGLCTKDEKKRKRDIEADAYNLIILSLNDNITLKTPLEIWDKLKTLFENQVTPNLSYLKASLFAFKMDSNNLTPFVIKTYEMVEDPTTDDVIYWSRARNSLIVWDSKKFAKNLLPIYFKHSNFYGFTRLLKAYPNLAIDSQYTHQGFVAGHKNLLRTISRNVQHQQRGASELEAELEKFMKDPGAWITELKQEKQQAMESIITIHHRLDSIEEQLNMLNCLEMMNDGEGSNQCSITFNRKCREL
ncbi:unnamed protein product [Rhodiola kirilowii]